MYSPIFCILTTLQIVEDDQCYGQREHGSCGECYYTCRTFHLHVRLHSSASQVKGIALLCCYAAHVASYLLMLKDSLSSRIKHAHIDKYICKGVMHDCTPPGSQSVVATCFLVIEILVVV